MGDGARRGEGRRDRPSMSAAPMRSDAVTRRPRPRSPLPIAAIAAVVVVARPADQALGAQRPRRRRNIDVIGRCGSTWRSTAGMAFSQGDGPRARSSASSPCSSSSALLIVDRRARRAGSYAFAVGLIIGGAVGNVLDRLFRGDGLVPRRRRRLHRRPVVADLQRRRHRRHRRRRAAAAQHACLPAPRPPSRPAAGGRSTTARCRRRAAASPTSTTARTMITEEVPAALAGERLDRIVALLADVSRSAAAA